MKNGRFNKSWLLIPLVVFACTSGQQANEESAIDTEAVDQELAKLDQAQSEQTQSEQTQSEQTQSEQTQLDSVPTKDETESGFTADTLPPESNLGDSGLEDVPYSSEIGDAQSFEPNAPIAAVDQASETPKKKERSTVSKPIVELSKIETTPFRQGDFLLNAVYISRPKDTFKRISEKIYGSGERVKDLKKMNPNVSSLSVGTKIYYNSPTRPQDETSLKVYYEDMGMIPQTYISQSSEPLKSKSKELLGFDNAWKEIWSTHPRLESKTSLPAGSEIYYWPDLDMITPKTDMAAAPSPELDASKTTNNDFPPPPPMPEALPPASDNLANGDFPPPPAAEMNPPPPPPAAVAGIEEDSAPAQDETMLMLGGIGVLTAGIAGLIVVRKRRQQKEAAALAAMENTHIGS